MRPRIAALSRTASQNACWTRSDAPHLARRSALISRLSNVARLSALAASSYERTDAQLTAVPNKAMESGTGAQT